MIQRGSGLGLLHKPLHSIRVSSNVSGQNLQRNLAIEFGILRQIHLAHSALANLRADFVAAESDARRYGHNSLLKSWLTAATPRAARDLQTADRSAEDPTSGWPSRSCYL